MPSPHDPRNDAILNAQTSEPAGMQAGTTGPGFSGRRQGPGEDGLEPEKAAPTAPPHTTSTTMSPAGQSGHTVIHSTGSHQTGPEVFERPKEVVKENLQEKVDLTHGAGEGSEATNTGQAPDGSPMPSTANQTHGKGGEQASDPSLAGPTAQDMSLDPRVERATEQAKAAGTLDKQASQGIQPEPSKPAPNVHKEPSWLTQTETSHGEEKTATSQAETKPEEDHSHSSSKPEGEASQT